MTVFCIASRGRGGGWTQHFEARKDKLTSTLTSVTKDNMLLILTKVRTEEGKTLRRQYKNDIGVPFKQEKILAPKKDNIANTVTSFAHDNMVMTDNLDNTNNSHMEQNKTDIHPTKAELLHYFGKRIRVRKMHEKEALRLMDVDDKYINQLHEATEQKTLKSGKVITKPSLTKTAKYKLAGNSIVVSCLYHLFRTMFIPDQKENEQSKAQASLFDD